MSALEGALACTHVGLSVFTVHGRTKDGACTCGDASCKSVAKHPISAGWKVARPDVQEIRALLKARPWNFGVLCGAAGGVWVLDVDGDEGRAQLAQLEEQHGELPATTTVRTRKGVHMYFKHPGEDVRIKGLVRFLPGLDSRGEGGYVVGPGCTHATGFKYGFVEEHAPADVGFALAPEWLLELVKEQPEPQRKSAVVIDLPIARDRVEAYGVAALEVECRKVANAPEGERNATLFKATATLAELVAGGVLPEGTVKSALRTAAIDGAGLGTTETTKTIASGIAAGEKNPRTPPPDEAIGEDCPKCEAPLVKRKSKAHGEFIGCSAHPTCKFWRAIDSEGEHREDRAADEWPAPISLTATAQVPPFPVDALPAWAQFWVRELSRETQTAEDLPAMLLLGALATACGGRLRVHVRGTWTEPTNLYLLAVQPPGNRKSAVFRVAEAPFSAWEQERAFAAAPIIAAKLSELRAADQRVSHAESKLSKAHDAGERMAAQHDVREAVEAKLAAERDVPSAPRLLCSDVTPEQLARLLYEQGGRMALMDAEGCGPFAVMLGRYAEGGSVNFDVFLKAHVGDSIRVDRVKREPLSVDRPALTLVAMGQPELLRTLGDRREARGLGLLARILWFVPVSPVGHRDLEPEPMNAAAEGSYLAHVGDLLNLPAENAPRVLEFGPDAWPVLKALSARIEPQLAPGGELESIADWAAKLVGTVARIAGLLHAADYVTCPWEVPVSADVVRRAVAIGDYLLEHARAAFEQMGTDPLIGDAQHVLRWFKRNGQPAVTGRDLYRGVRGRFKRPADLDPVLELLAEHGWVRVEAAAMHVGAGRKPSPTYRVHPSVLAKASNASPGDRA